MLGVALLIPPLFDFSDRSFIEVVELSCEVGRSLFCQLLKAEMPNSWVGVPKASNQPLSTAHRSKESHRL